MRVGAACISAVFFSACGVPNARSPVPGKSAASTAIAEPPDPPGEMPRACESYVFPIRKIGSRLLNKDPKVLNHEKIKWAATIADAYGRLLMHFEPDFGFQMESGMIAEIAPETVTWDGKPEGHGPFQVGRETVIFSFKEANDQSRESRVEVSSLSEFCQKQQ